MIEMAAIVDYAVSVDGHDFIVSEFRVAGSDKWEVEAEYPALSMSISFRNWDGAPYTLAGMMDELREWLYYQTELEAGMYE